MKRVYEVELNRLGMKLWPEGHESLKVYVPNNLFKIFDVVSSSYRIEVAAEAPTQDGWQWRRLELEGSSHGLVFIKGNDKETAVCNEGLRKMGIRPPRRATTRMLWWRLLWDDE